MEHASEMVLLRDVRGAISRRGRRNEYSGVNCCSGGGCESRSNATAQYSMMSGRLTEQLLGLGWYRTFAGTYMLFVGRERVPAPDNSMLDRLSRFASPCKARLKLIASYLAVVIRSSKKHVRLRLWLRSASWIPRQCLRRALPAVPGQSPSRWTAVLCSSSARIWRVTASAQGVENQRKLGNLWSAQVRRVRGNPNCRGWDG